MAKKQKKGEPDSRLLERVMSRLGLTQSGVAVLLGKSQAAISWVATGRSLFSVLERRELRRALARDEAVEGLVANRAPGYCAVRLDPEVGPGAWAEHAMECPWCLQSMMAARADAIGLVEESLPIAPGMPNE